MKVFLDNDKIQTFGSLKNDSVLMEVVLRLIEEGYLWYKFPTLNYWVLTIPNSLSSDFKTLSDMSDSKEVNVESLLEDYLLISVKKQWQDLKSKGLKGRLHT